MSLTEEEIMERFDIVSSGMPSLTHPIKAENGLWVAASDALEAQERADKFERRLKEILTSDPTQAHAIARIALDLGATPPYF